MVLGHFRDIGNASGQNVLAEMCVAEMYVAEMSYICVHNLLKILYPLLKTV